MSDRIRTTEKMAAQGTPGDMNEHMSHTELADQDGAFGGEPREPLLAPLPAVREWLAYPTALLGLGCLAGAATQVAQRFGLSDHALVTRASEQLASVGGSIAVLGIGGAALVGIAAGALGRMRQTRRMLDSLAQSPDYGAWLEDLDEGLQRMHVSLVTVESHVAGSLEHVQRDLAQRVDFGSNSGTTRIEQLESELGSRLMRLESTLGTLSATVARLEERVESSRAAADVAPLLARLEAALDRSERAPAPATSSAVDTDDERDPVVEHHATDAAVTATAPASEDALDRRGEEPAPITASVDDPAPAIPQASEEIDEDACPVDGLPLFAGVEDPEPAPRPADEARSAPSRRNPYES